MTWILAGATVMLLSAIAVSYRRADRDRCRATHPTARPVLHPLAVAANGDAAATPVLTGRPARHLHVVHAAGRELSHRS